jgi:REP element-mobilizing transposase RayT
LRLDTWNYSNPGAYFLTICAHQRKRLFDAGDVKRMIEFWWRRIGECFENTGIDEFIIMPDHLHGIILILDDEGGPARRPAPTRDQADSVGVGAHPRVRPHIVEMIQWFKTMSTNAYIHGVYERGWPEFEGHLWQRGYYDRIIRNEKELAAIREYIQSNPERLPGN